MAKKKLKTTGLKFDQDKADLSLIPYEGIEEVAKVMMFGARKYAKNNWRNGISITRLISAAQRHTHQANEGQDYDDETKTLHFANAACNLFFAIWMLKHRPDLDDRWTTQRKKETHNERTTGKKRKKRSDKARRTNVRSRKKS